MYLIRGWIVGQRRVESYVWLLSKFKQLMSNEPLCMVIDQDPSMRISVPRVMPSSRQRFCMWYIMMKVSEKVGPMLAQDMEFK